MCRGSLPAASPVARSPPTAIIETNNSAELELTVPLLVQIDKLVMLIESPVFTSK